MSAQSYKNHMRWDPPFHFFALLILLLNPFVLLWWHLHHRDVMTHLMMWAILVSVALFIGVLKARVYALKAQDRAIRAEEKLRLQQLCAPGELAELDSLTMRQYIGLRFAGNAELPGLARRAIRENLTEKQIKEAIVAWRPDHDRV